MKIAMAAIVACLAGAPRTHPEDQVTSEEATTLFRLRCVWEHVYRVEFRDGVWSARRLSGPITILTADTGLELRDLMRDDCGDRTAPMA
jgi:hypothetical protein